MQVNSATDLKTAIQVDVQKKAQDVVKNVVGKLLEDTFKNTMAIEQQAAAATGKGMNLNVQA
jgi:hypothetical protein